jgi:Uncharacterized protein conserved in archaea
MNPRIRVSRYLNLFFTLLLFSPIQQIYGKEKKLIGWVEKVRIYPSEMVFNAKIDTGARNSSINAQNIIEFERDDQTWVRFDVINKDKVRMTLELPLVREAKIKRHFGKSQQRHVVVMGVCLGPVYKQTEVTLIDREGFLYGMLIGRSFLKNRFIVNPSETFTTAPACKTSNNE